MIVVTGMAEAQAFLAELREKTADDWEAIGDLAHAVRRYGVSISPSDTGSYAAAHQVVVTGKTATISIDPLARNTETGILVTRYAGDVEARHQVYGLMFTEARRLVVAGAEELIKELGI